MDNLMSVWCFVFLLRCLIYKVHAALAGVLYYITTFNLCQGLFSSFSSGFRPVSRDSFVIIPPVYGFVKGFFSFFQIFFSDLFFGLSPVQLFSSKLAPHWRQVTLIFPFPRGTRSFTPQEGHLKILYCRRCSLFIRQVAPKRKPRVMARNF